MAEAQVHLAKMDFPIGAFGANKDRIDGLMGQMARGDQSFASYDRPAAL